jgi:hypothetical protein
VQGASEQFATVTEVTSDSTSTTGGGGGATSTSAPPVSTGPGTAQRPSTVSATGTAPPGVDSAGNSVSYAASNLIDGNPTTAWRVAGDGRGTVITLRFDRPVKVTSLGFVTGYAKTDTADGTDRFRQNRRVLALKAGFADGIQDIRLADVRDMQRFAVSHNPTTEIKIEIVESTPNPERDFTAMSEIEVLGTVA